MSVSYDDARFVKLVAARLGIAITDEQVEFASDFTKPLISFSNPGTGKTFSTVIGLLVTQTLRKVPGDKINAMSFTKAATAEMRMRYVDACKRHGMTPTVKFNTFHSICYAIVREAYPNMKIKEFEDYEGSLPVLAECMKRQGVASDDMFYVKNVLETINYLNSSLCFDESNIGQSFKFNSLNMQVKVLQELRKDWLLYGLAVNCITRGDIPIYALYVLHRYPSIMEKYRNMYRIMVVDEFQDLSLLHLKILSMITYNLVAIGDMKQQIYAFNGASMQIVDEYCKMFPEAKRVNLTQSFRCRDEISKFATGIIQRNDPTVRPFVGVGPGATIDVVSSDVLDLQQVVEEIKADQELIGSSEYKDSMFLFRNNTSAIPLADALYRNNVRFRMPRFLPIYRMPIFKEICTLVDIALYPNDVVKVDTALRLFPEFRRRDIQRNPVVAVMEKTGRSFFDIPYKYREASSYDIVNALRKVQDIIAKNLSAGRVFNCMLPIYEKYIIEGKWWKLPREKEYYFDLIAPIVNRQSYMEMITTEIDKSKYIQEAIDANFGVRCYTVHVAKGLEASKIYLLDADKGIFPNDSSITKCIEEGCSYEAARILREERNLLYVAVTRAKEKVVICYDTEVTPLISDPINNQYCDLDKVYDATKKDYDDVGTFTKLFCLDGNNGKKVKKKEEDDGLEALLEVL